MAHIDSANAAAAARSGGFPSRPVRRRPASIARLRTDIARPYTIAMLTHLAIKDFAVVRAAELEFGEGMTVISGETGAG